MGAKVLGKHQPPLVMSQINGNKIQGSQNPEHDNFIGEPKIPVNSLQTQFKIMKRAIARCPKVNITIMGENKPLLLDSSSMVRLMSKTDFTTDIFGHGWDQQEP